MKLTEQQLRKTIREELQLIREKSKEDDIQNRIRMVFLMDKWDLSKKQFESMLKSMKSQFGNSVDKVVKELLKYKNIEIQGSNVVWNEGKVNEAGYIGSMGGKLDTQVGKNYKMKNSGSGDMKMFGPGFSSKEAKSIMDRSLINYSKVLRKAKWKIIKDWLSHTKSGRLDYFDIVMGISTGDARRASPDETDFLMKMLSKEKLIDRFRSYTGGKKGMKSRREK